MTRLPTPPLGMPAAPRPGSAPLPGHNSGQHRLSGHRGPSSPAGGDPAPHAPHAPPAPPTPGHQMGHPGNELGVVQGDDQVVFLTEEEFRKDFLRENHLLPILVLVVCGGLAFLITAIGGLTEGGVAGAIGAGIFFGALFGVSVLTGSLAAWAVGKLFAEDFGSFPTLLLRIAAVTAAEFLVFMCLAALMGPIPTILVGLPVLLVLVVWLVGMNLLQAFVFSVILKMIEFLMISFVLIGIANA